MFFVEVDIDTCEACGDCLDTCPNEAFVMTETDGKAHVEFVGDDGCIGCESCIAVCPTGSLTLVEM